MPATVLGDPKTGLCTIHRMDFAQGTANLRVPISFYLFIHTIQLKNLHHKVENLSAADMLSGSIGNVK